MTARAASFPKEPAKDEEREWERFVSEGAFELMVLGFDLDGLGVVSTEGRGAATGPGDV